MPSSDRWRVRATTAAWLASALLACAGPLPTDVARPTSSVAATALDEVEPVPLPGLPSKPKRIDQLLPDEQALIVDAGTAQSLECVNGGAMVTLEGNVLGVDAARTVAYRWTEGEALIAEALTATVFLPLGTHQLTLAVIEDGGRVGHLRLIT